MTKNRKNKNIRTTFPTSMSVQNKRVYSKEKREVQLQEVLEYRYRK